MSEKEWAPTGHLQACFARPPPTTSRGPAPSSSSFHRAHVCDASLTLCALPNSIICPSHAMPPRLAQHTAHTTYSDPGLELSHLQSSSPRRVAQQNAAASPDLEPTSITAGPLQSCDSHEPFPSIAVTTTVQGEELRGPGSRVWHAIMSRNPLLLIRSSPALGTGSYGAVPLIEGRSRSSSPSEDEENGHIHRRSSKSRGKRVQSEHDVQDNHGRFVDARRRYRSTEWPRRRQSSSTCDVGMGLDAKTSFAVNGAFDEDK